MKRELIEKLKKQLSRDRKLYGGIRDFIEVEIKEMETIIQALEKQENDAVILDEMEKFIEEQEFEELTRGGYPHNITRRDRGDGMVNGEVFIDNVWRSETWHKDGNYYIGVRDRLDLIPTNPRKKELQAKEAELLKQLEEIRKELGNE